MIIAGSSLRVTIAIDEDIGPTGTAQVRYNNSEGAASKAAVIDDSERGLVHIDFSPAELSQIGTWSVWGYYLAEDGRTLMTPAKQFKVFAEGTVQQ